MHKSGVVVFAAGLLATGVANAFTYGDVTVSGYGTLSASRLTTDGARFRTDSRHPGGVNDQWGWNSDSKLGLQATYKATSNLSATLHVLSQQNVDNSYRPRVEWGYVDYKLTPQAEIRLGRMGLPAFMASDYLNVNYSMTAVRGPVEVYSQLPISSFDGVDMLIRSKLGGASVTLQPLVGRSDFQARFSDASATLAWGKADVYGLNVIGELGNWTMRAGYIGANVSIASDPGNQLIAGLRAMGAGNIAGRLEYNKKNSSFAGVGATYDDGRHIVQGEFTQRRAYGFLADTDSWYVMGGTRIGAFTPYLMHASQKVVSAKSWSDVPAAMSANVNGMLAAGNTSQRSCSAGVRWDFASNMAAKLQISRITPTAGSTGGLLIHDAAKGALGSHNLMTISVDSVF